MKEIIIEKKNSHPLSILDDSNEDIVEYTRNISKLLELNNVSILETTSSCVVIRPNEISSIQIKETEDTKSPSTEKDGQPSIEVTSEEVKIKETEEEIVDYITDGD